MLLAVPPIAQTETRCSIGRVIGLPLSGLFAFQFHQGLPGIWWGLASALTIQAVSLVAIVVRTDWKDQACIATQRTSEGRHGDSRGSGAEPGGGAALVADDGCAVAAQEANAADEDEGVARLL